MFRSPSFLRPATNLALLAVLLMALAPSVSRLLASIDGAQDGWAALCTSMGLTWSDAGGTSPTGKPSLPGGDKAMGDDCGYCQLLHSLPLVLLFLGLLVPRLVPGNLAFLDTPRLRTRVNGRGLGGQGPPLVL